MAELQDVIDKVHKLLALAQSSNPHEAALAAAKAQEMMFQYHLDMDTIGSASTKRQDKIDFTLFYLIDDGKWHTQLINAIAKYNFAKVIIRRAIMPSCVIVAREEDIAQVKYLYCYLSETLQRLCKSCRDTAIKKAEWEKGFYKGAVLAISDTLHEQFILNQNYSGGTALVLRSNKAVDDKFDEMFPDRVTTRRATKINHTAAGIGYQEGRKIGINKGLGHKEPDALKGKA